MFKTSLIYFLIRAINGVLALAMIYILTRLLSAEQYGLYALGMAGIGLCGSVFFQWIAVAVSRFYAAHVAVPDALLTEAYRLFSRIALVGLLLTAIYVVWSPMPSVTPVLALAIGVGAVAMGLHSLGLQVANARGKPVSFGLLTFSRGAFALAAAVAFVQAGFGGAGAVFGVALASVLSVAIFGARRLTKAKYSNPELRRQMIVYGLPLTLTYFSTMVLDVSDRFMIGWWLASSAVAGYAASYDLTQQTVGAILNVFFLASYPAIIVAWERGGIHADNQAMRSLSRALMLAVPLMAGLFIGLAPEISSFFFGVAVQTDAAKVMPWVAFAISIGCFKTYYLDIAFHLTKETHMQLRITAVMAVLNVALNLILLPRLGVIGAAISTAVAFTTGTLLSWLFGRRLIHYPHSGRDFTNMLVALAALSFCLRICDFPENGYLMNLLIRLFTGLAAFSVAVFVTDLSGVRSDLTRRIGLNVEDKA
jgi:O-antigen/teichoic acid export membrane protein